MVVDERIRKAAIGVVLLAALVVGARLIPSGDRPEAGRPQVTGASPGATAAGSHGWSRARNGEALIHVAGAVKRPGVYRVDSGARVRDAVRLAGGPGSGADLDAINLAARVNDGQQVVVPSRVSAAAAGAAAAGGSPAGPVSLGNATAEQLDGLDGVGPAIAKKIIDWRSQHGGFGNVDELDQVPGIGPKKLEALRSQLAP